MGVRAATSAATASVTAGVGSSVSISERDHRSDDARREFLHGCYEFFVVTRWRLFPDNVWLYSEAARAILALMNCLQSQKNVKKSSPPII